MALFKCHECGNDVSSKAEFCPHCGVPISHHEQKPIDLVVSSAQVDDSSPSGRFMLVLAWVIWIGGIIVSYISAKNNRSFDWTVFLSSLVLYIVAGGFAYCFRELLRNIWVIASAILRFNVKSNDK